MKHKVLGKTWNWGTDRDDVAYVPQKEEANLKQRLAKARRIAFKPRKALPVPKGEGKEN